MKHNMLELAWPHNRTAHHILNALMSVLRWMAVKVGTFFSSPPHAPRLNSMHVASMACMAHWPSMMQCITAYMAIQGALTILVEAWIEDMSSLSLNQFG